MYELLDLRAHKYFWNAPLRANHARGKGHMALYCPNMNIMVSQITGNFAVCSSACLGQHERRHQSCALLALWENQWWLVDSLHKGPVMWRVLQCHDVILGCQPIRHSHSCRGNRQITIECIQYICMLHTIFAHIRHKLKEYFATFNAITIKMYVSVLQFGSHKIPITNHYTREVDMLRYHD